MSSVLKCPVCDGPMRIKAAKNGKPFADCRASGHNLQLLLRSGVEEFSARYGTAWKGGAPVEPPKPATPAKPVAKKGAAPATAPKETVPAAPVKKRGFLEF